MNAEHSGTEQYVLSTVLNSTPFSLNSILKSGSMNLFACSIGIGVLAQQLGG